MEEVSFKERVKNAAIDGAKLYKNNFIDYEYLICSMAFKDKKYYVAKADEGKYLHLIGIHTELSPKKFFQRCLDGSLLEDDFDSSKKRGNKKYDELLNGDKKDVSLYVKYISELIDEKFISNE